MTDTLSSFYVTGGTLPPDAPCYVEREADRVLLASLRRGELCHVLTSRQMGKSSLMVRTAARLRAEGVTVAVLDLTALGQNLSAEQWYRGLLTLLGEQLGLEPELARFWEAHPHLGPLHRWMAALAQLAVGSRQSAVGSRLPGPSIPNPQPSTCSTPTHPHTHTPTHPRLVIFIDEIDAVRNLPFPSDELFGAIRECHNRQGSQPGAGRLTFCLLGVAAPSDLVRDPRVTPFNLSRRIELTDFTEAEALPLASGLVHRRDTKGAERGFGVRSSGFRVQGRSGEVGEWERRETRNAERGTWKAEHPHTHTSIHPHTHALLRRILYWTGGHPYLTQRLCQAAAERMKDEGGGMNRGRALPPSSLRLYPFQVDRLVRELFLSRDAQRTEENLLFVQDEVLRGGEDPAAVLELYARVRAGQHVPDAETNPCVPVLRLAGLVRAAGGRLRLRNRVYTRVFDRRWVREHLPGAELRRQRAAYRRGFVRAAGLAILVLAVVSGLALRAVTSERKASGLAARLRNLLKDQERTLGALRGLNRSLEQEQQRSAGLARHEKDTANRERIARKDAERLSGLWRGESRRSALLGAQALDLAGKSQAYVGRLLVEKGTRLTEQEDPVGALPWFVEALRLDGKDVRRAEAHRMRIASTLARMPRLLSVFDAGADVEHTVLTPDGSRVVLMMRPGRVGVWDAVTGQPVLPPVEHINLRICLSMDGRLLATADRSGQIRVWDTATGRLRRPPLVPGGPIVGLGLSPCGTRLASCEPDGRAQIWRLEGGALRGPTIRLRTSVAGFDFSADGSRFLIRDDHNQAGRDHDVVQVYDTETGAALFTLDGPDAPNKSFFHPTGRWAFTRTGSLAVWDVRTGRRTGVMACTPPPILAYSPDNHRMASLGGAQAKVYNLPDCQPFGLLLEHPTPPVYMAFNPTGDRVLTITRDGTVRTWDTAWGRVAIPPTLLERNLSHAHASRDGRTVLTVGTRLARVWDLGTPAELFQRPHLSGHGISPSLSEDGEHALVAVSEDSARLVALPGGEPAGPVLRPPNGLAVIALDPTARYALTAASDGTGCTWDARSGQRLAGPFPVGSGVFQLALSRDGRLAAVCRGDRTATIQAALTGRVLAHRLPWEGLEVEPGFSPDGRHLVLGTWSFGWDGTRWRCEYEKPQHERDSRPPGRGRFSPEGGLALLGGGDGSVRLGRLRGGRQEANLLAHPLGVTAIAASPDGARLATGSSDHTARIWDMRDFRNLRPLTPPLPHGSTVQEVAFSPDGHWLATVETSGLVRVWDSHTGELTLLPARIPDALKVVFRRDNRSIVIARHTGGVAVLPLARCPTPVAELARLARLLSGTSLEAGRGAWPANERQLTADWAVVGGLLPGLQGSRQDSEPELRRLAFATEDRHEWAAATTRLEALARRCPDDHILLQHLGRVLGEQGRWAEAVRAYSDAHARGQAERLGWYNLAVAAAAACDLETYRRACRLGLDRVGATDHDVEMNVWSCVLAPGALPDLERAARMVQELIRKHPEEPDLPETLGALRFRAGRYAEAEQHLREAARARGGKAGILERLFLAMTLQRLGRRAEALRLLDETTGEIDQRLRNGRPPELDWQGYASGITLRREAEALIRSTKATER